MIDFADSATLRLNSELNNNDLRIQLTEIMKAIDSYDVIDVEEFDKARYLAGSILIYLIKFQLFQVRRTHLNLLNPMPFIKGPNKYRRMYTRGDLKMREGRQGTKV